jgi:hypothetical protein
MEMSLFGMIKLTLGKLCATLFGVATAAVGHPIVVGTILAGGLSVAYRATGHWSNSPVAIWWMTLWQHPELSVSAPTNPERFKSLVQWLQRWVVDAGNIRAHEITMTLDGETVTCLVPDSPIRVRGEHGEFTVIPKKTLPACVNAVDTLVVRGASISACRQFLRHTENQPAHTVKFHDYVDDRWVCRYVPVITDSPRRKQIEIRERLESPRGSMLVEGDPGVGKTSGVLRAAYETSRGVYSLPARLQEDVFAKAFSQIPARSVVLLDNWDHTHARANLTKHVLAPDRLLTLLETPKGEMWICLIVNSRRVFDDCPGVFRWGRITAEILFE